MDFLILVIGVALLTIGIRAHMMTKIYVKEKIEKSWFDRLWTGDRPPAENLTEEGLRYRKQSNLYSIAGFVVLGLYLFL